MIMDFTKFRDVLNDAIFEQSKVVLIEKIARCPGRHMGLFRPTKPKAKILQNLIQSHEIRLGDAFEFLIEEYLKQLGHTILDKKFSTDDNDKLNIDQCFKKKENIFC